MTTQTITDLREALFATLNGLKNGEIDVDRAKAINETAQVIINSAKVEIDHMKIAGGTGTRFIAEPADLPKRPHIEATSHGTRTITQIGNGATITTHKAS